IFERTNSLTGDLSAKPVGNATRGRRPGRRSDWRKQPSDDCSNFLYLVFRCPGSDSVPRPALPRSNAFIVWRGLAVHMSKSCVNPLKEPSSATRPRLAGLGGGSAGGGVPARGWFF